MTRVPDMSYAMGGFVRPIAAVLAAHAAEEAIYIPDFNPARLAASGMNRMFEAYDGSTAATDLADTVGLLVDESKDAAIGADLVTNGGFSADASWTKGTGWSIAAGVASFTATGSASNLSQNLGLVANALYEIILTVTRSAGTLTVIAGFGNTNNFAISASGTNTVRLIATGDATLYLQAGTTFTGTVDNVSVKRISGNHLRQTTAGSRPTIVQVGDDYALRFDGTDDFLNCFLAPPNAGMTVIVAGVMGTGANVQDYIFGATNAGNERFRLGFNPSNGNIQGSVGTDVSATFTGLDYRGRVVLGLRAGGGAYNSFRRTYGGTSGQTTGSYAGNLPNAIALAIGGTNTNGTVQNQALFDLFAIYAVQGLLSNEEMNAVSVAFQRRFGPS